MTETRERQNAEKNLQNEGLCRWREWKWQPPENTSWRKLYWLHTAICMIPVLFLILGVITIQRGGNWAACVNNILDILHLGNLEEGITQALNLIGLCGAVVAWVVASNTVRVYDRQIGDLLKLPKPGFWGYYFFILTPCAIVAHFWANAGEPEYRAAVGLLFIGLLVGFGFSFWVCLHYIIDRDKCQRSVYRRILLDIGYWNDDKRAKDRRLEKPKLQKFMPELHNCLLGATNYVHNTFADYRLPDWPQFLDVWENAVGLAARVYLEEGRGVNQDFREIVEDYSTKVWRTLLGDGDITMRQIEICLALVDEFDRRAAVSGEYFEELVFAGLAEWVFNVDCQDVMGRCMRLSRALGGWLDRNPAAPFGAGKKLLFTLLFYGALQCEIEAGTVLQGLHAVALQHFFVSMDADWVQAQEPYLAELRRQFLRGRRRELVLDVPEEYGEDIYLLDKNYNIGLIRTEEGAVCPRVAGEIPG